MIAKRTREKLLFAALMSRLIQSCDKGIIRRYGVSLISYFIVMVVISHPIYASEVASQSLFTITKVTDGDSLRAGPIRIRLHGIDAPEIGQICEIDSSYDCGRRARDYLADILGENATVRCDHLDTDRYQRFVMRCYHRGIDISAGMVRAGWALAYRRYARDYIGDEADAKKAQRGLWAGTFETPEKWRRTHK